MESSTIIENKNKLISLVQDIVNEYNIMSELKIQKNCESSLEHRRLNDLIRDQEKNTQEQQKLIENLPFLLLGILFSIGRKVVRLTILGTVNSYNT